MPNLTRQDSFTPSENCSGGQCDDPTTPSKRATPIKTHPPTDPLQPDVLDTSGLQKSVGWFSTFSLTLWFPSRVEKASPHFCQLATPINATTTTTTMPYSHGSGYKGRLGRGSQG
ncbi:hypothetical protein Pmani_034606 [Petrolisthes manimaculis]|uniref:Uncharacterized protein n=1 Tax=Petrolisthes manimaculis TaxID=1843537 RepID=A0AAE1NN81_9EUCA|nr:hypothetical protein Pmani_034606 [Petrolisthes manimaculis]